MGNGTYSSDSSSSSGSLRDDSQLSKSPIAWEMPTPRAPPLRQPSAYCPLSPWSNLKIAEGFKRERGEEVQGDGQLEETNEDVSRGSEGQAPARGWGELWPTNGDWPPFSWHLHHRGERWPRRRPCATSILDALARVSASHVGNCLM